MNTYQLRFLCGPQEAMRVQYEHQVLAASLEEALATQCCWPVQSNREHTCAWAKHPGTSVYDVAAWEAQLVKPPDLPAHGENMREQTQLH